MSTRDCYLDITQEMKIDHDNVRDLFDRYHRASSRKLKGMIANTLIREMAIHGEAKELSVYNDYPQIGLGDAVARNKEDSAEIKACVHDADVARRTSDEYDVILSCAISAFLAHAKQEEDQQLPLVRKRLTPEESDKMARAFLKARTKVPTRPHSYGPQTGGIGQKAVCMPARIQDMVVETIEGREFVELKYHHPTV
ncbi:hypothetical protein L226DRAFT_454385 [Lentinus tigrinus ALCF2SS1-7]|uniref:Hemerythrin-like domain-containing protein n=1 Tax=Lentinus tigrinus ALCF2SS1-6 TaxID=1328759 RepID=A0A5C2SST2_9APHY|nr:hypothetical protein L227DRAFT_570312 [Lentinus tigrinus ALCF2SS1-6]RPD80361.1 hypothetical protein L226DRAFT_454385 [Lentinus tigrinus ALCF2SS1-7]